MAKVTSETVTPEHVKASRAFLRWTAKDLAGQCSIGVATVRLFESGGVVRQSSRQAIFDALVNAGVEFQNGGKPGVRLTGSNQS